MSCNSIFLDSEIHTDGIPYGVQARKSSARAIGLAVCVIYITVSLLSLKFISTHENHVHDHDGADGCCVTCAHIAAAQNLLTTLSAAIAAIGAALSLRFRLFSARPQRQAFGGVSLVSSKVRMND
jgi:drug/metabolite transporter superfamily protein YnfA